MDGYYNGFQINSWLPHLLNLYNIIILSTYITRKMVGRGGGFFSKNRKEYRYNTRDALLENITKKFQKSHVEKRCSYRRKTWGMLG